MSSLILMKGLPFTKGHEAMIRFALSFGPVRIIMDYAPDEPLVAERKFWIYRTFPSGVEVDQIPLTMQTEDDDPNFWGIWTGILEPYQGIDYVVGSEPYCQRIADIIGATYMPFDPDRTLFHTQARYIRHNPWSYFHEMSFEAQKSFRTTVTVFGAESTGKTTLSDELAQAYHCPWVHEYARPYLTATSPAITVEAMEAIWRGQYATESLVAATSQDNKLIFRDTDLWTTVGYWEQPHWSHLGPVPEALIRGARSHTADLYLITQSNIPFEPDPLRYGGDHRESPDEYWVKIAEKYDLPYEIILNSDLNDRIGEAVYYIWPVAEKKLSILNYTRSEELV